MEKIVVLNTTALPSDGRNLSEELPSLINDLLQDGYTIKQTLQSTPSDKIYCTTFIFILEKN